MQTFFEKIKKLAIYFYRRILGKKPCVKFFIFTHGRSGGSVLRDLLNSHSGIYCEEEILTRKVFMPRLYIDLHSVLCNTAAYSFKIKLYQLTLNQKIKNPEKLMSGLHKSGWKIIYLRRDNIFYQVASLHAGLTRDSLIARGGDFTKKQDEGKKKIKINHKHFAKVMKGVEEAKKREDRIMSGLPHLKINYETDLLHADNHQNTMDRVCDYLDLPHRPCSIPFIRMREGYLADYISNYDELLYLREKSDE